MKRILLAFAIATFIACPATEARAGNADPSIRPAKMGTQIDGTLASLAWSWPAAPAGTTVGIDVISKNSGSDNSGYTLVSPMQAPASGKITWMPRVQFRTGEYYAIIVRWYNAIGQEIASRMTTTFKINLPSVNRRVAIASPANQTVAAAGEPLIVSWCSRGMPANALAGVLLISAANTEITSYMQIVPMSSRGHTIAVEDKPAPGLYYLIVVYVNEYGLFCQRDEHEIMIE